jgi:hypothetical protein
MVSSRAFRCVGVEFTLIALASLYIHPRDDFKTSDSSEFKHEKEIS